MIHSTTIIRLFCKASVLLSLSCNGFADAFCTYGTATCFKQQLQSNSFVNFGRTLSLSNSASRFRINPRISRRGRTRTFLVSEEDVLEAVERAETLWAEALEARKEANTLIDKAEKDATASAGTAKEAENIFKNKTTPVTMEELVQVDNAAKVSLDATSLINRAMEAEDQASKLESEAEQALKKSEEALDQHLIDFPDSSLTD